MYIFLSLVIYIQSYFFISYILILFVCTFDLNLIIVMNGLNFLFCIHCKATSTFPFVLNKLIQ